ncbi:MAG: hypothetical protein J1E82_02290 [Muribaculaceae bacterium]|nr:hypothetical protein [Muribaculaceae bacterium]
MTAKEIMLPRRVEKGKAPEVSVDSEMPVLDVLPRLLDSPCRELSVTEEGEYIGRIDEGSLLEGLGRMIAARDDSCVVTVECDPSNYSASAIAHAVEDTDAHLVDLMSVPGENGKVMVTLRIRNSDPSSAIRSLERYDYHVVEAHGSDDKVHTMEIATERLLSLQALMNV